VCNTTIVNCLVELNNKSNSQNVCIEHIITNAHILQLNLPYNLLNSRFYCRVCINTNSLPSTHWMHPLLLVRWEHSKCVADKTWVSEGEYLSSIGILGWKAYAAPFSHGGVWDIRDKKMYPLWQSDNSSFRPSKWHVTFSDDFIVRPVSALHLCVSQAQAVHTTSKGLLIPTLLMTLDLV
jgi:hypothetical protein